jgi:hypothetical protein
VIREKKASKNKLASAKLQQKTARPPSPCQKELVSANDPKGELVSAYLKKNRSCIGGQSFCTYRNSIVGNRGGAKAERAHAARGHGVGQ